jgi:hypothetical protein
MNTSNGIDLFINNIVDIESAATLFLENQVTFMTLMI